MAIKILIRDLRFPFLFELQFFLPDISYKKILIY